jgi:hypothetical protein
MAAVERILRGFKTERKTTPEVTLAGGRNLRRRCQEVRVKIVTKARTANSAVKKETETVVTEMTEATEAVVVKVTEVAMVTVEASDIDLFCPLLMRAKVPKCSLITSVSKLR